MTDLDGRAQGKVEPARHTQNPDHAGWERGALPVATAGVVLMLLGIPWTKTLGSLAAILVFGVATVPAR